jgi:hypothetical protein
VTERVLPYLLDIKYKLSVAEIHAGNAVELHVDRYLLNYCILTRHRWTEDLKMVTLLGDAAFGTVSNIQLIKQRGGHALFAFSENASGMKWLWELLTWGLPPNKWRAVLAPDGIVYAARCMQVNNKMVHQFVGTTIYDGKVSRLDTLLVPINFPIDASMI